MKGLPKVVEEEKEAPKAVEVRAEALKVTEEEKGEAVGESEFESEEEEYEEEEDGAILEQQDIRPEPAQKQAKPVQQPRIPNRAPTKEREEVVEAPASKKKPPADPQYDAQRDLKVVQFTEVTFPDI